MNEQQDNPEQKKTVLQHIWDIAKAVFLVGAEKLWNLTKKLAKWISLFAVTNPIPALIIAGVLLGLIILWLFWPSSDSQNQKKADNAAEQSIEKTAEVEQQKEVTANVEGQIETQKTRVEAANANVAAAGSRTKAARERAAETSRRARNAANEREKASQTPVKDSKLDEVIANCEKIYTICR
jgi:septal ring factor EnvC (AmiA/AmiB activator)